MYVTCIGGHVASLYFDPYHAPLFTGFPRTIAALQHLRHIRGAGRNAAAVTFPCEFGKLANLKALVWGDIVSSGSGPLLFPEDDSCMDGLVSLEEVMIGDYEINRLPSSFVRLPKLQTLSVGITKTDTPLQLPPLVSPELRVLKLSRTGTSGPLPSFKNSSRLEEISLDRNNLGLGSPSAFDFCPKLRKVDVSYNNLSMEVFTFEGSTNIEAVDISHNSIRGGIPNQWSSLTSCSTMKASHNFIEGPLQPFYGMKNLEFIALSHNRIAWYVPKSRFAITR
jgi:Leucine-rich repeat (LRR) protein